MRLFWRIYLTVFISFVIIVSLFTYIAYSRQISYAEKTVAMALFLSLLSVIILGVILYFTVRRFTRPVREMIRGAEAVGQGDLTHRIEVDATDELGQLAESFNRMTEGLRKTTVSKSYVDNIITDMSEALLVVAPDARIMTVNRALVELLGYREDELIGQPCRIILDTQDTLPRGGSFPRLMDQGGLVNQETLYRAKDGRMVPVLVSASVMKDREDKPVCIVCTARDITERKQAEKELHLSLDKLKRIMEGTIQAMALTVELRDPYTAGHQRRVAELAWAIAREMDLPEQQIEAARLAAAIHDIGKITVPAEILNKPGRINATEFEFIRAHPQIGYNILKTVNFPWPIAEIVRQHHQRLDGSGYPPRRQAEEGIMLEARILSVADVVEAMSSHRPYRPAPGIDKAIEEITKHSGQLYDPDVVTACCRLLETKGYSLA